MEDGFSRLGLAVRAGNVHFDCLIDTGASISLLHNAVFKKICEDTGRTRLLKPAPLLFDVSGSQIKVYGKTEIPLDMFGNLDVVVVDGIAHHCIIGDDILTAGRALVDYDKYILTWKGKQMPVHPYNLPSTIDSISHLESMSPTHTNPTSNIPNSEYADVIAWNQDVFYEDGKPFGQCPLTEVTIDTGSHPPIRQRPYRTPLAKRKVIDDCIDQMLKDGVIEPSNSPWASPVCLVPKKDGTTRFCVDYRKLNEITVKDRYPLPLIQDIFDQLGGKSIYSICDLKAAYNQLPVAKKDQDKTAFICHRGLFNCTVGSFGLANMPSIFQRTMERALSDLLGKCVWVFIDDLIIASESPAQHKRDLQAVFDRLRAARLQHKASKCYFGEVEVRLLGYIITPEGISSDPEKVRAIVDMPAPMNVKQVRSFMGMVNYYSKTIPGYARISEPLVRLTRKHQPFSWGPEQQKAFESLKELLMSRHVMAYPRTDRGYKLFTDASDTCVGGILVQDDDDGVERVIQYVSHQLSATQRKWSTIEKEAFAVVHCIDKLRAYLYGADFVVYTDHKPLRSLFTKEMRNTKIQRWEIGRASCRERV